MLVPYSQVGGQGFWKRNPSSQSTSTSMPTLWPGGPDAQNKAVVKGSAKAKGHLPCPMTGSDHRVCETQDHETVPGGI